MEWISIKDQMPDVHSGKFKVKTEHDEFTAYFYKDQMIWIEFYGQKPCHWWDVKTKDPIYNATHWMPLPNSP